MLSRKMNDYLQVEIPKLNKYSGIMKIIMLWWIRKNNHSADAVYMYRYCLLYSRCGSFLKKRICARYKRLLVRRYGFYFSVTAKTKVGKGIFFPHPTSIVIGADATIGENCTVYQNVTIGGARIGDGVQSKYPSIGDNCVLFAGCKVLGDITLGEGTQVGANAVLLKSTEVGSIYAGVPAKRIK